MASVRINGTLGPVLQPVQISYDPSSGVKYRLEWESAGDNLRGAALGYQNARVSYDLTTSSNKSRMVATATSSQLGLPDLTVDTWQVLANEIQKDIKEHPDVIAMETAYPGTMSLINRDLGLYNQGLPVGTPAPNPGAFPTAGYVADYLYRGATHYAISQYVVRHTTNVANDWDQDNPADDNVNRLYTTTQLLAEIADPLKWTFPLPLRLQRKLTKLTTDAGASHTGRLWSWLKKASTETTSGANRIEICTEYWFEEWSTFAYKLATGI